MAFTDNFNGVSVVTDLTEHTPSGGTAWTAVGSLNAGVVQPSGVAGSYTDDSTGTLYRPDDQGSSAHYSQYKAISVGNVWGFVANRATDAANFLGVRVVSGELQLLKRQAGSFTVLGSWSGVVANDIIRFESNADNEHTVKVNGTVRIGPIVDTFNSTQTRQGLVPRTSAGDWWDDYEAGALGGGGPPEDGLIVPDGIWTWFSEPRAIFRNGATYVGVVQSSGFICVGKFVHSTGTYSEFTLSSWFEVDDHDNAAVHFLPDGRILALYSRHNDTNGIYYRISTNPEDISAWGTEQVLTVTTPNSYVNPHYLSASGKTYVHYRSGLPGVGNDLPTRVRAFNGTTWDAERAWITNTSQRPYVKSINNGVDRIDFFFTNSHPNEGASSVYHCYMRLDAGVEKFYKSDGVEITTVPVRPENATLIYDGSSVDSWVWDITYGADGHPRVLFARFPVTTDHRYMFSRWTGTAWTTPVEITAGGTYLYSAEVNYSGGICFDSQRPNVVYLSKQVGATTVWEVEEWITADNGATWTRHRNLTPASTEKNCRPYSPRNHDGQCAVVWWRGEYNTYVDYTTRIIGAAKPPIYIHGLTISDMTTSGARATLSISR